jgi:two-component system, NarL family, nitrate/nitrite response regulator NarL
VRTVKNHVHNILQKLQVSRRGEAAARLRVAAARQGAGVGR